VAFLATIRMYIDLAQPIIRQREKFSNVVSSLTRRAPANTGAFYFFNHAQPAPGGFQYLAPSRPFAAKLETLLTPQPISTISTHSKVRHLYSLSLLIHLFPQRNYQIHRSLSPSRMPLARLNLTAIRCHSSGI